MHRTRGYTEIVVRTNGTDIATIVKDILTLQSLDFDLNTAILQWLGTRLLIWNRFCQQCNNPMSLIVKKFCNEDKWRGKIRKRTKAFVNNRSFLVDI